MNGQKWTEEQIEFLRENYSHSNRDLLVSKLNRKWETIVKKASLLNLSSDYIVEWSVEEDNIIINEYPKYEKKELKKAISSLLPNRSWKAIVLRATKLGVSNKLEFWTDTEEELFKKNYLKYSNIELIKMFFPNKSLSSLACKASSLGIKKPIQPEWTDAEDAIIIEYWGIDNRKVKDLLKHRTESCIKSRVVKLNKQYVKRGTPELKNIIIENHYKSLNELVILSGLSKYTISSILKDNNLNNKYLRKNKFKKIDSDYSIVYFNDVKGNIVGETIIDTRYLENIINLGKWSKHSFGYAYCHKFKILLHRYIYGLSNKIEDGYQVDHIDGNRLNNTLSNLRIVTNAENAQNKHRLIKTNKSGCTGVCKVNDGSGRWLSQIHHKGVAITFGYVDDFDEACLIANCARAYLFPYSPQASTIDIKNIPQWIKDRIDSKLSKDL